MFVKLRNDAAQKSKNACNTYDQIQDGRYQHDIDDPKAEKDTKDNRKWLGRTDVSEHLLHDHVGTVLRDERHHPAVRRSHVHRSDPVVGHDLDGIHLGRGRSTLLVSGSWIRRQIRRFSVCSAGQELEKSVRFAAGSECSLETNSSSKKLVNAI